MRRSERLKRRGQVKDRPPRKPASKREPIPDLWEIPGTRLPGNPKAEEHDPEFTYIIDVRGERVCVSENRVTRFKASSVRIEEIYKVRRPVLAPKLWTGPRHHAATHALRLIQSSSITTAGDLENTHERRLRGEITPKSLLTACGASHQLASILFRSLRDEGLLREAQANRKQCWFVSTLVRGFGPQSERYTANELGDGMVLPEFVSSLTQPRPPDSGKEVGSMSTKHITSDRHEALTLTLITLQEAAGETVADGYVEMPQPKAGFFRFLQGKLGVTPGQARLLLENLEALGCVEKIYSGKPHLRLLRIRANVKGVTPADVASIRRPHRVPSSGMSPAIPAEPDEGAVEATPEMLAGLISRLEERLTDRDTRIAKLEAETTELRRKLGEAEIARVKQAEYLGELQSELEETKKGRPVIMLSGKLAKLLGES